MKNLKNLRDSKRCLERLDKIIASTGRFSRREVKALIRQGRVVIHCRPDFFPDFLPDSEEVIVPKSAEEKFDPEKILIAVDGEPLCFRRFTWVMLYKPAGVLSATEDGQSQTVLDLLPEDLQRQKLFPVGRLDRDAEGLLLLTNEGKLAHDLLSPRHHVDKVYAVRTAGRLTEDDCQAFASGIILKDGKDRKNKKDSEKLFQCLPAKLKIISAQDTGSEALVTIQEGKFHQVKRMFATCGKPVRYLQRVKMGNLTLDPALRPGEFRFLTPKEQELLRNF